MPKNNPLYYNIAKDLMNKIENGFFEPIQILPTEQKLCNKYHVSRVTIRSALKILVENSYIKKKQGSGSEVIYSKSRLRLEKSSQVRSYSEELKQEGKTPFYYILSFSLEQASKEISHILELTEDKRVFYYKRVLYDEDYPYCFEISYMPYSLFPDLSVKIVEHSRLDYIENKKKYVINYSHQTVKAILPTEELSKELKINMNTPLLEDIHTTYDMDGKPLFYTINVFDTNHYKANFIKIRNHN